MAVLTHITFDLDETLFDFRRTLDEALHATSQYLERVGHLRVSPAQLQKTRDALAETPAGRAAKLLELRKWSLAKILRDHPEKQRLVTGAMEVFEATRFGQVYLYPDAQDVLETLARQYRLAAVTNGNTDPETSALSGLFETTVFAEACGFAKPDPRIFGVLMHRLTITDPASVLHVGDALINDVHCGAEAGVATVWLNPNNSPNTTHIAPTYEIRTLRELPQVVQHHASRIVTPSDP